MSRRYEQKVSDCLLDHPHNCEETNEHNWEVFKKCVMAAGEEVAGRGRSRNQPDWFVEAADSLQPLIDAKNAAMNRFLHAQTAASKEEFRRHQRMVK